MAEGVRPSGEKLRSQKNAICLISIAPSKTFSLSPATKSEKENWHLIAPLSDLFADVNSFAVDLINFTSSSSSSLSPQMLRRFVNFGEIYRPVFLPLVDSSLYRILNEQTFSLHRLDGVSKKKFRQKNSRKAAELRRLGDER